MKHTIVNARLPEMEEEEIVLIKSNYNGLRNVTLKVYASRAPGSPMNCKFARRVDGKLEIILSEMINNFFDGICVLEIVDFFAGPAKTLRLVPQEFLVEETDRGMFYFDDVADEDEETDEEEIGQEEKED